MSFSIFEAAGAAPHAEALVCDGLRLSFSALAERVRGRSAELRELGVVPAQHGPVGLIADGSLAMFEYLYLLFALGVPVMPLQPRLTPPERALLLALCGARTVLDPSQAPPREPASDARWDGPSVPAIQPLALVASSGSSGTPKIVELSRRAFVALARADAERVPPNSHDRALLCLPLSHVGGLSVVTRALLFRRCCVVFQPGSGGLLSSVPELANCLVRERISLLSVVPPLLTRLLREAPSLARRAPLRAVLIGGQACSAELFAEASQRAIPLLTSYGMTETCSQISTLNYPLEAAAPLRRGIVGVGFPLPGVELRIVNGLIEVRGETLFTRYLGRPTPWTEDGYFNTGDRGEFDPELGLFVYGRASELIITGGENVDPIEVEHALLACGGLEAVCVFGVPDPEFGERVAVAIETEAGAALDEPALFEKLTQRLATYKQPRLLCRFERLPRLASGKLDRVSIGAEARPRLRPAIHG